MKYKRLTERTGKSIGIKETSTNDNMSIWNAINRLAELEDKIERGELVDVKENHLIAISRTSGKSSKQLEAIEILTKYENGMLVELPRIIHPNKAEWHMQYQYPSGVIQYDICFSQAEAEAELKKEKQNESGND